MENGSWASTAGNAMKKILESMKDMTILDTEVKIMSSLNDEEKLDAFANAIVQSL